MSARMVDSGAQAVSKGFEMYLQAFSNLYVLLAVLAAASAFGIFRIRSLLLPFVKLSVVYALSFVAFLVLFNGQDVEASLKNPGVCIRAAKYAFFISCASGLATPKAARQQSKKIK